MLPYMYDTAAEMLSILWRCVHQGVLFMLSVYMNVILTVCSAHI